MCKIYFASKTSLAYFGNVTAQHSTTGRQPNFAALSRGRHIYSAGRPSRLALAHILVFIIFNISVSLPEPAQSKNNGTLWMFTLPRLKSFLDDRL